MSDTNTTTYPIPRAIHTIRKAGLINNGQTWRYNGCHGGNHSFTIGTHTYLVDLAIGAISEEG